MAIFINKAKGANFPRRQREDFIARMSWKLHGSERAESLHGTGCALHKARGRRTVGTPT